MFTLLLAFLILGKAMALIEEIPLPMDLEHCYESYSRRNDMTKVPSTEIQWICMQKAIWRLVDHRIMNISDRDRQWIDLILQIPDFRSGGTSATSSASGSATAPGGTGSGRQKRQAGSNLRIRTEYRLLNDLEREQYHRAVNALKQMPIGNITRYDFIANIHRGDAIPAAHFSPNFLGWHRVYLLIYENALRQIDPTVTVPYFASELDEPLDDPKESVIWSNIFLGNGDGVVRQGPYANWKTPSGPLVRNIGAMGQLFSNRIIQRILNKTRTEDITEPTGNYESNIERQQYLVTRWIGGGGGQMSDLNSAAHDPCYFNHYAYIDYIWEQFRMQQQQKRISPENDYPVGPGSPAQNEAMGFGTLKNIDGFSSFFTESVYTYEYLPECSVSNPHCNSPYLRCDTTLLKPLCVSLTRGEWNAHLKASGQLGADANLGQNTGGFTFGQSMHSTQSTSPDKNGQCPKPALNWGIQNRYRCDDMTDIREWVYIPVEIVSRRPPEKTIYDSYPVFHGNVIYDGDVYSPDAYRVLRNALYTVRLGRYDYCKDTSTNAGKIYIKSEGLNYYGTYQEYAVVDNRLALSSATAYVAIRSPELGLTQTLITAHDSCGRMCSAYCRIKGRSEYQPCHGALQLTSATPKQYSLNFGEGVEDTWEFFKYRYFPRVKDNNIFIKFFCSYNEYWPKKIEKQPTVMSSQQSTQNVKPLSKITPRNTGGTSLTKSQVKPSLSVNTGSAPKRVNTISSTQRANIRQQQRPNMASSPAVNTGSPTTRVNAGSPATRVNAGSQTTRVNTGSPTRVNTGSPNPRVNIGSPQRPNLQTANTQATQNIGQDSIRNPGCLLGHGCIVAGSCRTCTNGQKMACIKSTTLFAHCQGTTLLIRRCLARSRFDPATGTCRLETV